MDPNMFDGFFRGIFGAGLAGLLAGTAAAKYGPWWTVPFAAIVGGWLGGIVGMFSAL